MNKLLVWCNHVLNNTVGVFWGFFCMCVCIVVNACVDVLGLSINFKSNKSKKQQHNFIPLNIFRKYAKMKSCNMHWNSFFNNIFFSFESTGSGQFVKNQACYAKPTFFSLPSLDSLFHSVHSISRHNMWFNVEV